MVISTRYVALQVFVRVLLVIEVIMVLLSSSLVLFPDGDWSEVLMEEITQALVTLVFLVIQRDYYYYEYCQFLKPNGY